MKPISNKVKPKSKTARTQKKKKSGGHTIKFSLETEQKLNDMRALPMYNRTFNNMVEYLVENSAEFVRFKQ